MHTATTIAHPLDAQDLLPVDSASCAEYRRNGGSLDTITGYLVVQTITPAGDHLPQGDDPHVLLLASLAGSGRYGEALDIARAHRAAGPGEWALVYTVHEGGYHAGHGYELEVRRPA